MKWKPEIGTIYCLADELGKTNLFYEVAELTLDKNFVECERLHITYKVYDYRNAKNVNIYYVKLEPLIITKKHIKKDLVIYFQHSHGESKLATHTITDAKRPEVYKTTNDNKATATKLNKLLINNTYLCKHNNFNAVYGVEKFYTLYNILSENHRLFGEIITPYDALYNKIVCGEYEYDFIDYTKQKFNEMCKHKNIYDKLSNPTIDDEDEYSENEEEDEEEDEEEEPTKTAEEEINMF
jgi:hypothetical protein